MNIEGEIDYGKLKTKKEMREELKVDTGAGDRRPSKFVDFDVVNKFGFI